MILFDDVFIVASQPPPPSGSIYNYVCLFFPPPPSFFVFVVEGLSTYICTTFLFPSRVMTAISNPVTQGSLTDRQIAEAYSAERRSADVISNDFDSSVEGSTCSASSLWESSDHGDITGDESDGSTEVSGPVSEYESVSEPESGPENRRIEVPSTEDDLGAEGDDELSAPRYNLRPRKRKQGGPPSKRVHYQESSDDEGEVGGSRHQSCTSGGRGGRDRHSSEDDDEVGGMHHPSYTGGGRGRGQGERG